MKRESFLKRFLTLYLPLIVILLFILFPFYWTFITSIKPDTELYGAVTYWPRQVQWENYTKLFTTTVNFLAAMKNSFIVAAVTTVVSLTASTLASYAFSRYRFAGRRAMMALIFKPIICSLRYCFNPIILYNEKSGVTLYSMGSCTRIYNVHTSIFCMVAEWIF